MPEIFFDGKPYPAEKGQTVMQAAAANGVYIPYFCWHPHLSVSGNCRICVVEVEDEKGGNWIEIACNMPVSDGMRILTDSEGVRARRKQTMEFITLNHPVDCGICDKAGECLLQDHHYAHNGEPSVATVPKVHATKFHDLSERIFIDNERCILCLRCTRFTAEVSKSHGLVVHNRGDHSLVRATEDGAFARDAYSDNVIDVCPVGALLAKANLYKARVWYTKPTASVCPGCERGCGVQVWHRRPEWKLNALDPRQNTSIVRITPLENPKVNGPWICNKGRDMARVLERARATQAMLRGRPVAIDEAVQEAGSLIFQAKRPVALVSSWASNEELAAFRKALASRFTCFVKADRRPEPGEVVEDGLLIRPDKNPNGAGARALFGSAPIAFPEGTDLVLVWGEGLDFGRIPKGARIVFLNAFLQPENGHADVFLPTSLQTERRGHYTNFEGTVSAFEPCFARPAGVADAESLFAALAAPAEVRA